MSRFKYSPDKDIEVHAEGTIRLLCSSFQSHENGLPEWLKNSADAYAREDVAEEKRDYHNSDENLHGVFSRMESRATEIISAIHEYMDLNIPEYGKDFFSPMVFGGAQSSVPLTIPVRQGKLCCRNGVGHSYHGALQCNL